MSKIPLVARAANEEFAHLGDTSVTVGQFCADVVAVAAMLPQAEHLVNLCQDRYRFTVVFFAALHRGQTNLLPAKREMQFARSLNKDFPDCIFASDQDADRPDVLIHFTPASHGEQPSPGCDGQHVAAIAFTSGSTGAPQPHAKSWRMLDTWRREHQRVLPGEQHQTRGLVATVPSWHMYGLEWALLLPTVAPLTLYCGADFYPRDVSAALSSFQQAAVLVSTPTHLRALSKLPAAPTNVTHIISATAPLNDALIEQIETLFHTEIFEIYGCSEIGSLACRYPARTSAWTFFDCFAVQFDAGAIAINHRELPTEVTLADRFRQIDTVHFELEGRATDIIKIGGKRESLANLNNILLSVEGVEDGVIYDPQRFGLPDSGRLAALVVAPNTTAAALRKTLAGNIESAFLPRPIRRVTSLPRDNISKLKLHELAQLIKQDTVTDA